MTGPTIFGVDPTLIGTIIGGIVVAGGTVWGIVLNAKKKLAEGRAEGAEAARDRTVADSQKTLFETMTIRLSSLEREMTLLREDLRKEREHSRQLELKFYNLDRWIRAQGLTPPSFDSPIIVAG